MHYLFLHYCPDPSGQLDEPSRNLFPPSGGKLGGDATSVVVKVKEGALRVYDVDCLNRPDQLERYWIVQARDLNDAIRIGSRILSGVNGYLEVRPILAFCDDVDSMTGTLQ